MRLNKKEKAVKRFIQTYFRDEQDLRHWLKADRPAVQYAWSLYTDAMCKNGEITLQEYESWTFPWPERK